jgi:putative ABC transport system permease protein
MKIVHHIRIALHSIRGNLVRAIITALIITTGITALVGILTAIDGIETSIVKNFSFMGSNSFNIENKSSGISFKRGTKRIRYPVIKYKEALLFKKRYQFDDYVSVFGGHSWQSIVKYNSLKTNPNTILTGADENYLKVAGYELAAGRNITKNDIEKGMHTALIGQEIKTQLFPNESPLNKSITIGGGKFRVVGILEEKGSAFDFGGNRVIVIPHSTARKRFSSNSMSYKIGVAVEDINNMDAAISQSKGLFRVVRKNKIKDPNNFEIIKSDTISQTLMENLRVLIIVMIAIAMITLLGATIALMNIMLVSVTERTKEIGLRKSIGAKKGSILTQFLVEAITICQFGGIGGVVLGIFIGNLVSDMVGGEFIIPWAWIILAFTVCAVVGVISGIWPAKKAANVSPIEAMRHE